MGRFGKLSYRPIHPSPHHLPIVKAFHHPSIESWQQNLTFHSDLGKNEDNLQEITLNLLEERPCVNL